MNRFQAKVLAPLRALLLQGITPEKLAWSVALGTTIAMNPILFTIAWFCVLVAAVFRLNHVAMQVANYVARPLQLVFLVPFIRAGERLFGLPPVPLNPTLIYEAHKADFWGAERLYLGACLRGFVAWMIVAPAITAVLYLCLLPLMRRLVRTPAQPQAQPEPKN